MSETEPRGTAGVLVTGASSGIGAAIAGRLARSGYVVGCLSRRGTTPGTPGCLSLTGDVTDEDAVASALSALLAETGRLAGVVNCAGRHVEGPSALATSEEVRGILDVNFTAAFAVSRLVHPHLKRSGGGLIVNIGSFYDRLGVARNVAYAASKAAMASMTKCLAVEWARDGIRVVDVAPGYIETELNTEFFSDGDALRKIQRRIPVGRVGTTGEVARVVDAVFAMDVAFLTGTTIYVDGGHGVQL